MEDKKNNNKAEAYEQIKKLGGNTTESIKTVKTGIGDVDIKVTARLDFNDIKKQGGSLQDRPYVYVANVEGQPIPIAVLQKITCAEYETAAAAFDGTKKIVEKYAEGIKAVEAM